MQACPKCGAPPIAIETATAAESIEVIIRCSCDNRWTIGGLTVDQALGVANDALRQSFVVGSTHAARGLFLELAGRADDAYEEYASAGRCEGAFDRAFCHERRAVFEAGHGWLRNALYSLQQALNADRRASSARVEMYEAAIAKLEPLVPPGHSRRARELEIPPGFGAKNEIGEPLTDDVIEVERLFRADRWDDAITALKALTPSHLIDAIAIASRGAEVARSAGKQDIAIALQEVVVHAYVIWASWSSSGSEGIARSAEVDRERARLREWQSG